MSRKEIGLREARQQLGDLVTAAQYGQVTVITRNGKPAAMLVPYIPEESAMDLFPGATIDVDGAPVIVYQAYLGGHFALILGEAEATLQHLIVSIPILDNGEEGEALRVWLGTPERTGIAPGVRSIREEYIRMVTEAIREEIGLLDVGDHASSDPADY